LIKESSTVERISIEGVRAATYKAKDSWWTVFLVDPYASRLVRRVAGYRWVTPNRLTLLGTALGFASAACFALADRWWLLAGAALFHLSFVVDCMDGKLARLQGSGSVFGGWLDYILDRFRVLACAVALMGGAYLATDRPVYLVLAFGVVVLDLFHYLDLLQIAKVKGEMRRGLAAARDAQAEAEGAEAAGAEALLAPQATQAAAQAPQPAQEGGHTVVYELSEEFTSRFGRYSRIRNFLLHNRIRPNVISGIEFQMAVFIVAPLIGPAALIPVTLLVGGLLMAVELAVIYKLWLAARAFARQLAALESAAPQAPAQQPAPAGVS
jgi:phosphatidylglycerophosphate synthase